MAHKACQCEEFWNTLHIGQRWCPRFNEGNGGMAAHCAVCGGCKACRCYDEMLVGEGQLGMENDDEPNDG